jgi:hypothetical protein
MAKSLNAIYQSTLPGKPVVLDHLTRYEAGDLELTSGKSIVSEGISCIDAAPGCDHVLTQDRNNTLTWVQLKGLWIDGKAQERQAGHGIALPNAYIVAVENCVITNCAGYGIGHQTKYPDQILEHVYVRNTGFDGTGSDSVDFKNPYGGIGTNVYYENCVFKNWGITGSGKSAFDIRGPINAKNLEVHMTDRSKHASDDGIRFRDGKPGPEGWGDTRGARLSGAKIHYSGGWQEGEMLAGTGVKGIYYDDVQFIEE